MPSKLLAPFLCLTLLHFTLDGTAKAQFLYAVTDLGTLGGTHTKATDVNDRGVVVGEGQLNLSVIHGFIHEGGRIRDFDTQGYPRYSVWRVNENGDLVGSFEPDIALPALRRAFLYSGGVLTDLGTLGGPTSSALGINDQGDIVGSSEVHGGGARAFIYSGGQMRPLAGLPGDSHSYAADINNRGQIVGGLTDGTFFRPYLLSSGTVSFLGQLPGGAWRVNERGDVTGYFIEEFGTENARLRAFLYSGGTFTNLGTLGGIDSTPSGMNDFGDVVGLSSTNGYVGHHAFLFSDGRMHDLNDLILEAPGWELIEATGINNAGQIVGFGWHLPSGQQRGFLLTPVPEPATGVVCGVGGLILVGRRRHSWCTGA